jgi:hypothetical protein
VRRFLRSAQAEITVSPSVVSPRQSIEARVNVPSPIDKVTTARIELGYHNFYRYRWAGHADAAAGAVTDAMWLTDNVGTTYGTDRDTKDWVSVIVAELPTTANEFTGGTASFRIPSWAPPSSPPIAAWSCRLVLQRSGRDVEEQAEFSVVTSPEDAPTDIGSLERVSGRAASRLEIMLSRFVFRPGDTIDGVVVVTPTKDLPNGDLRVSWQWQRDSHPLKRTPGDGEVAQGSTVQVEKRTALRDGLPVRLPFQIALPNDAAPTASAVNSSLHWFVQAKMYYAGFNSLGAECVRQPIVVCSAPQAL